MDEGGGETQRAFETQQSCVQINSFIPDDEVSYNK